jgi:glucose-6-phosphate 1-dehydrogenase
VEAAWRVVEPILDLDTAPHPYDKGTWGPAAADDMLRAAGGWRTAPSEPCA